jgi:AbrB family looped-hinge helix DNA binding protein
VEKTLSIVTVSSRFQIVIPSEVRRRMNLKPHQVFIVIEKDGVIHLIPERPLKEMRGLVKGVTSEKMREE